MQRLTDNQLIHRAYLASPVWKAKRGEALAFYGCKCNRCGEWGNDVHHKTYERVGGAELMEDLEVLCRECHEIHHALDRIVSHPRAGRAIHRRAIYGRLSHKHVKILLDKFPHLKTGNDLFIAINKAGHNEAAWAAAWLLGCRLLSDSEVFAFTRFRNYVFKSTHPKTRSGDKKLKKLLTHGWKSSIGIH